jgi:hypothetical protein
MPLHGSLPTCQASRGRSPSTSFTGEEIAKLLAADFIKEVSHSDWLANIVHVKKKNGK